MGSVADLHDSPLAGALWETMVFTEVHRLLAAGVGAWWQLAYWRDRTKEADFVLHRAGHVMLADAKWTQQPTGTGRLEKVRGAFNPRPSSAIICRCESSYPMDNGTTALPLAGLAEWLA